MGFLNPSALWLLPLAAAPLVLHLLSARRAKRVRFSDLTPCARRAAGPGRRRACANGCSFWPSAWPWPRWWPRWRGPSCAARRPRAPPTRAWTSWSCSTPRCRCGRWTADAPASRPLGRRRARPPGSRPPPTGSPSRASRRASTRRWPSPRARRRRRRPWGGSRPAGAAPTSRREPRPPAASWPPSPRPAVAGAWSRSSGTAPPTGRRVWAAGCPPSAPPTRPSSDWPPPRRSQARPSSAAAAPPGAGARRGPRSSADRRASSWTWSCAARARGRHRLTPRAASLPWPPQTDPGPGAAWKLPPDALSEDDVELRGRAPPQGPALAVRRVRSRRGGYALKALLAESGRLPYRLDAADLGRLSQVRLAEFAAVVLDDPRTLTPGGAAALAAYVEEGGGLFVIPGRAASALGRSSPCSRRRRRAPGSSSPGLRPDAAPRVPGATPGATSSWRGSWWTAGTSRRGPAPQSNSRRRRRAAPVAEAGRGRVLLWASALEVGWAAWP
jgi:hypothetical protein